MEKEILEELKNTKYQLDQYRLLTNKLINQNVSQYNIDKFVEEEYIQTPYNNIYDYDYDLYNWLSPDLLDEVSNELIRLETQLKKQQEIIDKIEKKIKENIENAKYEIATLTITDKVYYKYIDDMLNDLLETLEDKEV